MTSLKPWQITLMQFAEPIQLAFLGGSQMAYLRYKARTWHEIAHTAERIHFTVKRCTQEGKRTV